ncbi:uncharacterized protein LOC133921597 [Phragmites australis]|uniref:uncharacterized protein LOC133921597 n=1 Tax=Phragmites australis TaxID=29695 RepID=UPI002D77AB39|nr:uncharacterized protein LOC133921597 [Phragmites australis]
MEPVVRTKVPAQYSKQVRHHPERPQRPRPDSRRRFRPLTGLSELDGDDRATVVDDLQVVQRYEDGTVRHMLRVDLNAASYGAEEDVRPELREMRSGHRDGVLVAQEHRMAAKVQPFVCRKHRAVSAGEIDLQNLLASSGC